MIKSFFDFPTMISFVLGIIVYIVAIYPTLNTFIQSALAISDPMTASVLHLIPAAVLISLIISMFRYAFGHVGQTYQGG